MPQRTLKATLIVAGHEHEHPVVARIVDNEGGAFAGWLLLIDDDPAMPGGWADGWLRPVAGGPDVAIRLRGATAGRVYFASR